MAANQTQLRSLCSKGLVVIVVNALESLSGVGKVRITAGRKCHGRKVKIPDRWPHRHVEVTVSDAERGEHILTAPAEKPGAILRILGKRLIDGGINVC